MLDKTKEVLSKSPMICDSLNCSQHPVNTQLKAGFFNQLADFFYKIFNTTDWPARWHCGQWTDFHGWLYIFSDVFIWAAYFAIPVLLFSIVKKRKDIPFSRIFWLFIAFIMLCGTTHLVDAIIFWWPAYRLSALIRFATAIVSVFTVYALYKTIPFIYKLRTLEQLEAEIEERKKAEEEARNQEVMKIAAEKMLAKKAEYMVQLNKLNKDLQKQARTLAISNAELEQFAYVASHVEYLTDRRTTIKNGASARRPAADDSPGVYGACNLFHSGGNMLLRLSKIARVLTILGVIGLLPGFTLAQATNPLVGSWNFKVIVTGGCTSNCIYIGMIAFNQGGTVVEQRGTVVEYSGLGNVERTALGTWRSTTGTPPYTFGVKNFVFDSTGNLSALILGTSGITLGSTLNSFSGSGTAKIYKPGGTLIDTETFTITGTRF